MVYEIFNRNVEKYDAWYDRFPGNQIFPIETACVRKALEGINHPWLEVGVGTGRFAQVLQIDCGLDPAASALTKAKSRGIQVMEGKAEALPYPDGSFNAVLMIITLCFLDDPLNGFLECKRVLSENGSFIVGIIPSDSPWGKFYIDKKKTGHGFYKYARFYSVKEVEDLFLKCGFIVQERWSTLHLPPERDFYPYEEPREGITKDAGFAVFKAQKN